jgi:hypothetical protein
MRRWVSRCRPPSIGPAGVVIAVGCRNSNILAPGQPDESRPVATSAGAVERGLLAGPSADKQWALNPWPRAFIKSTFNVILSGCWSTPIQAACVRPNGRVSQPKLPNRNLCVCLRPSPMSMPRARMSAARAQQNLLKIG